MTSTATHPLATRTSAQAAASAVVMVADVEPSRRVLVAGGDPGVDPQAARQQHEPGDELLGVADLGVAQEAVDEVLLHAAGDLGVERVVVVQFRRQVGDLLGNGAVADDRIASVVNEFSMSVGCTVATDRAVAGSNSASGSTVNTVSAGRSSPMMRTTRRSLSVSTGLVLRSRRPGDTHRTVSRRMAVDPDRHLLGPGVGSSSLLPTGVSLPLVDQASPL